MSRNGLESTRTAAHTGPGGRSRTQRTIRGRGGRRVLAPLVSIAAVAVLIAGCGGTTTEEPAGAPGDETTETSETSEQAPDTGESPSDGGGENSDDPETDDPESDSPETDGDETDDAEDSGDTGGDNDGVMGENLFEGTWGFGHDTKVLSAEELAALLEKEAEARGPEEMTLAVECGDGVDTGAGDYDAECIAYADEGVEHLWLVTVGPADAGLEIEVENAS